MGRPDADPCAYASEQIQTEYELQPQEYEPNHEATTTPNEYLAAATYQNNQQVSQQYPPPQPNQAYPSIQQPAQYPPPQNLQNNIPMYYSNKPNQVSAAAAAYPPQPVAVQYPPPKSPPTNQMYMMPPGGMQPASSPYKPAAVPGIPVAPGGGEGWRSGLFDFMDDPTNALTTAFFPCLTFGQIAEIVDDGHTTCGTSGLLYGAMSLFAMPCLLSCTYRTKLRNKFGLPEAPAPDWVTHFLCSWCALCQEYRELQHRGWDPNIGWHGNMARNQMQQPSMMAPMDQRMMG